MCRIAAILLVISSLTLSGSDPVRWSVGGGLERCEALSGLSRVTVLPRVQADQSRVVLLDLLDSTLIPQDWRAVLAGVDLGPAPAAGSRKYIRAGQLKQYIERFLESQGIDPAKVAIELPDSIVVDRRAVTLSRDEIEQVYRRYIFAHSRWRPEHLLIDRIVYAGLPIVPSGDLTHEVSPPKDGMYLGNVTLGIDYFVSGQKVRSLRVGGKVSLVQEVFKARDALPKDSVLGPDDIESARINVGDDPERYPSDPDEVVGKQLRRDMQPGEPIEFRDLLRPLVVKRGDPVIIFYQIPGFRLTAKGVVKESAGVGDRVRVMNAASKRTIYCRVLDAKTVSVMP